MCTQTEHKSNVTKTTYTYGTDATGPLIKSMNRLVVLSEFMSIKAIEGEPPTIQEVETLLYLIDEVHQAVDVFDVVASHDDIPF